MALPDSVYYFGTCLIDLLYPQAGLAGMKIIRNCGVKVRYPQEQSCCGQPPFNSGYRHEALSVARRQLTWFQDPIPIVIPSGSCAGMIKHHWPELFAGQPDEAEANEVASRVYELTEFLVNVLKLQLTDLGEPVRVAIHTSCSARREMAVSDHIEQLVGQLAKVEVVNQERKAECCGFGGTFAVKQAEISGAMVTDKCDAIDATGANVLLSQDCSCLMNISGAFDKRGTRPRSLHIAEFLLERTHEANN